MRAGPSTSQLHRHIDQNANSVVLNAGSATFEMIGSSDFKLRQGFGLNLGFWKFGASSFASYKVLQL
jgi:hypothetical protein